MKLYTEEQVMKAISEARKMESWWELDFVFDGEDIVKQLTPIELPSDEEIEERSIGHADYHPNQASFRYGAKWMRDKILNQNK